MEGTIHHCTGAQRGGIHEQGSRIPLPAGLERFDCARLRALRPRAPCALPAAASSCQMLSFLALAARARIDVVSYSDDAEAIMPEDDKPARITKITLRPRITVNGEDEDERVRRCVARAHQTCFIANSLNSEIVINPRIGFTTPDGDGSTVAGASTNPKCLNEE